MPTKQKKIKVLVIGKIGIYEDSRTSCFLSFLKKKNISFKYIKIPENIIKDLSLISLLNRRKFYSFFLVIIFLKFNMHKNYYSKLIKFVSLLNINNYNYIYTYDIDTALGLSQIVKKKNIIWDARDFYPMHFNQKMFWKYLYSSFYLKGIKKLTHKVKTFLTVSEGIKNMYEKILNNKFFLIYSLAKYEKLKPNRVSGKIKIIHHGICSKTRKIENYIETAKLLGKKYQITCMLKITDLEYFRFLKNKASEVSNFEFMKPVKLFNIPKKINNFDISLLITDSVSVNHLYSMPNKLFESIQARLSIVATPSKEISKFLIKHKCGRVTKNYDLKNIAYTIKKIDDDKILNYKKKNDNISKKYSYRHNFDKFNKIFEYI